MPAPPPRPCSQRGRATREFPRVAPRPGRAGGCSVGGGEQPGHQNRSRLWAGAALAGTLRRASSKDGQRVRRRPRPRSPLARRPAPRPGAAAGGRCPAAPPPRGQPKGSQRGPGAGERGRAASRARPRQRRRDNGARPLGRAERGAARGALPTPVQRPGAEGRGHPARRAARGALESSPRARPGAGRSPGGNAGPGPRRGARGNPCGSSGGGGAGMEGPRPGRFLFSPFLSRKVQGFPFPRFLFQFYFNPPFLGSLMRLAREMELVKKG